MPEMTTGDTQSLADAGQGQATDEQLSHEQILGLDAEGETEPGDAGQETQEEIVAEQDGADATQSKDPEKPEWLDARLERERRAAEERVRAEYEERMRQLMQSQQQHQPQSQQEIVEQLADQLGISTHAALVMLNQQLALNKMQEQAARAEAKAEVEALRANRPELPAWDDARIDEIRQKYQAEYGQPLPWRAAYNQLVAEEAMSGRIRTVAEQQTLANIEKRNSVTVQTGRGGDAPKPSIWDLPADEFEKMLERAKRGEFKRS